MDEKKSVGRVPCFGERNMVQAEEIPQRMIKGSSAREEYAFLKENLILRKDFEEI